jgi:glutaredoxin
MKPNMVRLFVKPYCPWCEEAEDWLQRRGIDYERLNVTIDTDARSEMRRLTGQSRAPSIEVDGHVLVDFDTGQLENFLREQGYAV